MSRHRLGEYFGTLGLPCSLVFATRDLDRNPSQWFRALFMQEMIARGFIMPSLVVSAAHEDSDIDRTVDAIDAALEVYTLALDEGVGRYLVGFPTQVVARRHNAASDLEIPRARREAA